QKNKRREAVAEKKLAAATRRSTRNFKRDKAAIKRADQRAAKTSALTSWRPLATTSPRRWVEELERFRRYRRRRCSLLQRLRAAIKLRWVGSSTGLTKSKPVSPLRRLSFRSALPTSKSSGRPMSE